MNNATLGLTVKTIKHFDKSVLIKGYNKRSYKKKGSDEYVTKFINVEFFLKTEDFEKLKISENDSIVVSGKAEMKSEKSKEDENKYFNSVQIHFPAVQKIWFGYGHPNHITLTGNIGSQEIKTTEGGSRFNRINVAVDGGKKKDTDERETWWMSCFIRGEKLFEDANKKMLKGKITIEGEIGEQSINCTSFWFKAADEQGDAPAKAAVEESVAETDDLPF